MTNKEDILQMFDEEDKIECSRLIDEIDFNKIKDWLNEEVDNSGYGWGGKLLISTPLIFTLGDKELENALIRKQQKNREKAIEMDNYNICLKCDHGHYIGVNEFRVCACSSSNAKGKNKGNRKSCKHFEKFEKFEV